MQGWFLESTSVCLNCRTTKAKRHGDISTDAIEDRVHSGTLGEIYDFSAAARVRILVAKSASFKDSRFISTFANAPSIAARARAAAVFKSDFMLGLVMGCSASAMPRISLARSATPNGTLVARLSAASTKPSPAAD